MAHSKARSRRTRALTWLPALASVGLGVLAAAGIGVVPISGAAPATSNTTVTATVNGTVSIDGDTCSGGVSFPGLGTSDGLTVQNGPAAYCDITFQSNGSGGTKLEAESKTTDLHASATTFMCRSGDCSGATTPPTGAFTDVAANQPSLSNGEAGFKMTSDVTTNSTFVGTGVTVDNYNPLTTTKLYVCKGNVSSIAHCSYAFAVNPAVDQMAETYTGKALFTATPL